MQSTITNIEPTKPVAPYQGGKLRLAPRIIDIINATPHKSYAECFVGMGGVFLRRNQKPKAEFINDYSRDVSNLFRVLQRHYVALMDMLKWQITSRDEFERLIKMNPDSLTDLERAARFLYVQRTTFGGKVSGRVFGVSKDRPARFDVNKLAPMLEEVHSRLSGVVIESLDYKAFITRYDHEDTLFYLDPPYYRCENDYGKGMFDRAEFDVMASLLSEVKGRFILSLNDTPEVRELFKDFIFHEAELTYSISRKAMDKKARELIIMNYDIKREA